MSELHAEVERLFDLVRYVRGELHQADLITDEEYAELAKYQGSVKRLETYDSITKERDQLRAELALWGIEVLPDGSTQTDMKRYHKYYRASATKQLRETLRTLEQAAGKYAEWMGPLHSDDCPGDDTCDGVSRLCSIHKNLCIAFHQAAALLEVSHERHS
jgi:hypothetical protein